MGMDDLHILSPLLGLLLNVAIQLPVYRCSRDRGLLSSISTGFLGGFFFVLLIETGYFLSTGPRWPDLIGQLILGATTYAALGYCYFHFVNLGETARRIRILRELHESEGGLSMGEILERYNAGNIIEARLTRLLKKGQIIHEDGRYYIGNPAVLMMARMISMMKILLLGKKSEFEDER